MNLFPGRHEKLGITKELYYGQDGVVDPITFDEKILRVPSQPTDKEELEKIKLVPRLEASLKTAWTPGVGLTAIQIGIPLKASICVLSGGRTYVLMNPVFTRFEGTFFYRGEGCLSIFRKAFVTKRFRKVTVQNQIGGGLVEEIHAEGQDAVILQHEIDHMNGQLCSDLMFSPDVLKVGRNELCPCGSGIKYKKCCNP